jgi:hypothetical protein
VAVGWGNPPGVEDFGGIGGAISVLLGVARAEKSDRIGGDISWWRLGSGLG